MWYHGVRYKRLSRELVNEKRLEDFDILPSDMIRNGVRPIRGFSHISLSVSPATILKIYKGIFEPEEYEITHAHYWPDTSFILESGYVYGTRAGVSMRLSELSFMDACTKGLTKLSQEYDTLWKEFHETKRVHCSYLEKIIYRSDVTLIPEVKEELTKGKENRERQIQRIKNISYQKIIRTLVEKNYRLARQIAEAEEKDQTLALLQTIGVLQMRDFCQDVALEHDLMTSTTDNMLAAYALANAAYCSGSPQIVLTHDRDLAELLMFVPSHAPKGVHIETKKKYYAPLKLCEVEILVAQDKTSSPGKI